MPMYCWRKPKGKRELGRATLRWKFAVKIALKEAEWVTKEEQI